MRVLAATAALFVSAAATAHADTTQPGTFQGPFALDAGPVLVDDRLVWAATTPRKWVEGQGDYSASTSLYSAPAAGGAAQRLAHAGTTTSLDDYEVGEGVVTLAASPGRLAWMTVRFDSHDAKYSIPQANAYGMSVLGRGTLCRGEEVSTASPVQAPGIALSGDTLVLSGCNDAPGVTLRDLAHPETPPQTVAPDGGPVSAAGTYVAWRTSDGFVLLDRSTGNRTTLTAAELPGRVGGFDVSPEGVLAVATIAPSKNLADHVSWASPAEPTWHTHALQASALGAPRVRANRIALLFLEGSGAEQLRLIDLAGAETVVAEGPIAGFDFDGTTVAWGSTTCDTLTVAARPVGATKLTVSDADHCPVVIDPATVRANRRGRAAIRLRCPAPALARGSDRCAGTLTLKRGGRVLARTTFRVAAGAWGRARIKLPAGRGRVRVTVEARSVTRGKASRSTQRITVRR